LRCSSSIIPPGTHGHNLELYPGAAGKWWRSAGGSAQLLSKEVILRW